MQFQLINSEDNKNQEFNDYCRFIENFYTLQSDSLKIKGVKKVVFEFFNKKDKKHGIDLLSFGSILTLKQDLDFDLFSKSSAEEKKALIIALLHEGIEYLAANKNSEFKNLYLIKEQLNNIGLEAKFTIGKEKVSKKLNMTGHIELKTTLKFAELNIVLKELDGDKEVKIPYFKTLVQPLFYTTCFGKSKWNTGGEFEVINKSGEVKYVVSIKDYILKVFFEPKDRDVEGLKEELRYMYYGGQPDWLI